MRITGRTTTESPIGQQVAPFQHPGGQRRLLRVQHQGLPLGARDGVEVRGSGAGHQHLRGGHRQQPVTGAAEGAEGGTEGGTAVQEPTAKDKAKAITCISECSTNRYALKKEIGTCHGDCDTLYMHLRLTVKFSVGCFLSIILYDNETHGP
ncbi:hypothetical protein CEXT_674311 [Caerostris extrusa]|uniref:Uncharacterized protein n=1 Tax=Caerostris extrusa TaxID=172846 RepID=A0AAV4VQ57_CAEEX|nr:hypothetical protein CEXT_674311 [Caerostris extrusa]